MRLVCFVIAGLTFSIFFTQVSANCLCGAAGEDFCTCNKFNPLPSHLLGKLVGPPPILPPIGDRCWCEKQVVQPAIPPKPCCPNIPPQPQLPAPKPLPLPPSPLPSALGCYHSLLLSPPPAPLPNPPPNPLLPPPCGYHSLLLPPLPPPNPPPNPPHNPPPNPPPVPCGCSDAEKSLKIATTCTCKCKDCAFPIPDCLPQKPAHPGIPADPVSVSLAYKMGKVFTVPEAKLQYGFRTAPINAIGKILKPPIPEEKLFALNKEIIELKKKKIAKKEEEIIEDESEEDAGHDLSYLTYKELGYCPEKFINPKFIDLPPPCPGSPPCLDPPPPVGDCGFKPGKIVQFAEELAEDAKLKTYKNCLKDV